MFRRRPLARMAVRTTVVAGTAMAVGAAVGSRNSGSPAPEAAPEAAPVEYAEAAPVAAAPAVDVLDELTKLGALKESGVLTQEEFDAQKARLLG